LVSSTTIKNDKWIAETYPQSLRGDSVSWSHHKIAAPYDNTLDLLKHAEEEKQSVREFENVASNR